MVVRILSNSASFNGINYNTDKVDKGKGELLQVSNFGALQGLSELRPEDYKNYLKLLSAGNKRVAGPQFHAVISAKGKEYSKHDLTGIANQWLEQMGYGKQPFLIVFHKDTANNHVHIVSTRIDRNGKKINSGFENIRAIHTLNKVMGLDEKHSANQHIANAIAYNFSTKAQFMMILETQGYVLREKDGRLELIKFGKKQSEIDLSSIEKAIQGHSAYTARKSQLKALFHKYAAQFDSALVSLTVPLPGNYAQKANGYTSEFAACLKEKFGISILYHASGDKMPYGYSVVDHAGKAVFKGGEIMPLKELLAIPVTERFDFDAQRAAALNENTGEINRETKNYYAAILRAALFNYPDLRQGLHHQELTITRNGETFTLSDPKAQVLFDCADLLVKKDFEYLTRQFDLETGLEEEVYRQYQYIPGINIADDVDDQQIFGPRRRRQKKARTNTR
jgi:Relaxase/Mobilisation nuclease domain